MTQKPIHERLPLRTAMSFRKPMPNPIVIALGRMVLPLLLRWKEGIVGVEYLPDELRRIKNLAPERIVLTPNHPTHAEPLVLFHLSKTIRFPFAYISNREAFDRCGGLFGWLLQRIGVYSVIRGMPDRDSFRMTRKLLVDGPNKLVVFPEGEDYSQNDTLLPFQSGLFQLLFYACDDMTFNHALYVQPVAVKYHYVDAARREIDKSMTRLERALQLRGEPPPDTYDRLRRIGESVVTTAETMYGLEHGTLDDMNPRIDAIKEAMIVRVADAVGLDRSSLGRTLPDRMRTLINTVHSVTKVQAEPESIYQVRLLLQERDRIRPLLHDLNRLSNWIAVKDEYVRVKPTTERMMDTLSRLEIEVLGKVRIGAKKRCFVRFADPFDLRDYAESYANDRRSAVRDVTMRTEQAVQALLDEMNETFSR